MRRLGLEGESNFGNQLGGDQGLLVWAKQGMSVAQQCGEIQSKIVCGAVGISVKLCTAVGNSVLIT